MNKGVKIAQGEIIGFLNADDFYHSDALKIIVMIILIAKI